MVISRGLLKSWSISPVGLAAAVLVVAGIFLGIALHHGFFLLVAVGAFGPGLLRRVGWLADLDELQYGIMLRAGHLAFVITGVFITAMLTFLTWGATDLEPSPVASYLVLLLLLVVYSLAYAISFWGPRKAARTLLLSFACFWLAFIVMSHADEPVALLMEGLVVAGPFLLAAAGCVRFPRLVGGLLLVACAIGIYLFRLYDLDPSLPGKLGSTLTVITTLALPLAVVGIALILGDSGNESKAAAVED